MDEKTWNKLLKVQATDVEKLKEKYPREWAIFSSIDTKKDGVIDHEELKAMCDQFGFGDLEAAVWNILDLDHSGVISFQELIAHFADI